MIKAEFFLRLHISVILLHEALVNSTRFEKKALDMECTGKFTLESMDSDGTRPVVSRLKGP